MVDVDAPDLYCRLFVSEADEAVVRRVVGSALGGELGRGDVLCVDGINVAVSRNRYRMADPPPHAPEHMDWPTSVELDADAGGDREGLIRSATTVMDALRDAGIQVVPNLPDEE